MRRQIENPQIRRDLGSSSPAPALMQVSLLLNYPRQKPLLQPSLKIPLKRDTIASQGSLFHCLVLTSALLQLKPIASCPAFCNRKNSVSV